MSQNISFTSNFDFLNMKIFLFDIESVISSVSCLKIIKNDEKTSYAVFNLNVQNIFLQ